MKNNFSDPNAAIDSKKRGKTGQPALFRTKPNFPTGREYSSNSTVDALRVKI